MNNLVNEKIIFSNNMNETELLRTLSKYGHNTFGVRVLNDVEICSYILVKNGKVMNGKYISNKEESFIYLNILGSKLDDATNIRDAINLFRDCVLNDSLNQMNYILSDKYKIKKETIINAYKKYIDYKNKNNLYDKYDMLLFIINNNLKINDVKLEYFSDFDIAKSFKEMLFNTFNNIEESSISDYLTNKNNKIDIIKAYGKTNEIDSIFNKINDENFPLDNCQIVLTNPKDIIELIPYLFKYNISYTSGIGIPFLETKPAKLLKILLDLKKGNYGVDGYKSLFKSNVFNSNIFKELFIKNDKLSMIKYNDFIKYAGWLRIGFDNKTNINTDLYDKDISNALNILNEDMKLGIVPFVKKYVIDDIFNQTIIYKMEEFINFKNTYIINISDDELLSNLFSSYVSKEISSSGAIHITNIDGSFQSLRDYNFIVGLDEDFPGNPKENYLIYDDEYLKTNSDLYLSKNIIERKINITKTLIKLSKNSILSYSYYGLYDLKEKNPSSIIYDLLSEGKEYKLFNFSSSNLNENKNIINARINNNLALINDKKYDISYDSDYLLSKYYSPSSIHTFFDDKISFVLAYIYGLKIDDEDNPYQVIQANEKGTLIHSIMEGFNRSDISEEDFLNNALKRFDEFLEKRPLIIKASKSKALQDYKDLILNLYKMEKIDSICIEYEKEIKDVEISGIKFKGTFDRIEKDNNGDYILVDYKTGKNLAHKDNDPVSCLQGLIYAYMIEHTNNPIIKSKNIKRIKRIEFRYPYLIKTIRIEYSKENELAMLSKIDEFKNAIINHDFISIKDPESSDLYIRKYEKLLSLFREVYVNE